MSRKQTVFNAVLIGGFLTLLFVGLATRLIYIQVVHANTWLGEAQEMWETDKILQAERGKIKDRNGNILAEDAPAFTISVNPQMIYKYGTLEEVVSGLTGILKTEGPDSAADLERKIREFATKKRPESSIKPDAKLEDTLAINVEIRPIGYKVDADVKEKVENLIEFIKQKLKVDNAGINIRQEEKRYYPGGNLASQVLGYSNKEGKPVMGLELSLDKYLKGTQGSLSYEKDRKGVELPNGRRSFQPAIDGNNVTLTIDRTIQFYIENALDKVYQKWKPKSLMAVAVDPKTMEILGLANMPDFNLNKYWLATTDNGSDVNHAISSQYEPGSTFKLVTLAGAVEEGIFNPTATYQSGAIKVPGRTLHDHNVVGWGQISYLEGLKRSSNVAFVKLGYEGLGPEKLKSYIDKFGFGKKTGIDLPGEVNGIVRMQNPSEFATATYGQGLTATAIQQVAAYGAIANGGKLMKPYIVKSVNDPETGEVIQETKPEVVRQVVSEKTAKLVGEYLENVVSDQAIGTGRKAAIEGYRIAGKTGTANKVIDGSYSLNKWVISFAGYAPLEDPKILLVLIADEPDLGGDYHLGGDVVAPAFKEIVTHTLRYMGVPSTVQPTPDKEKSKESLVKAPDLKNAQVNAAKTTVQKAGLTVNVLGKGSSALRQYPPAGTEIPPGSRMYIVTQDDSVTAPELAGKSLREALEVCSFVGVICQTTGEGYVASQTVTGEGSGTIVNLTLSPTGATAEPASNKAGATPTPTPKSTENNKKTTTETKR